jgi:hypothetical protein
MSKTRLACARAPLFSARWHVCCACLGIYKGDDATHDEFGLLVNQQIRAVRHGHHIYVGIALFQLLIFRQIEQAVLGRDHSEHGNGQSVDRAIHRGVKHLHLSHESMGAVTDHMRTGFVSRPASSTRGSRSPC